MTACRSQLLAGSLWASQFCSKPMIFVDSDPPDKIADAFFGSSNRNSLSKGVSPRWNSGSPMCHWTYFPKKLSKNFMVWNDIMNSRRFPAPYSLTLNSSHTGLYEWLCERSQTVGYGRHALWAVLVFRWCMVSILDDPTCSVALWTVAFLSHLISLCSLLQAAS